MIKTLIVDDHPATASGLGALLGQEPEIEVTGVSGTVEEALRLVEAQAPDVVLCDIELHGETGGFDLLRRLNARAGSPAVLFFSSYNYPRFRQLALELGAAGYLLKDASIRDIVDALRRVAGGGTVFSASAIRSASDAPPPSGRELEVIALVKAGQPNHEIADRLGIGVRGVESALRRLFVRYAVDSRTELVAAADEQGWLAVDRPKRGDA